MSRRAFSRLGRLVLALALLGGWQAALEHPLAHVDALGELVHLHDGDSHPDGRSGGPDAGALCDALAALTACAASLPQAHIAAERHRHSPASGNESAPRAADAPPFLSQGPPAFA